MPKKQYFSSIRTLEKQPVVRRDLIKRHLYLVPNSIVVSRGCPHNCNFCYKESFFKGGKSFYTQLVDDALPLIQLPVQRRNTQLIYKQIIPTLGPRI